MTRRQVDRTRDRRLVHVLGHVGTSSALRVRRCTAWIGLVALIAVALALQACGAHTAAVSPSQSPWRAAGLWLCGDNGAIMPSRGEAAAWSSQQSGVRVALRGIAFSDTTHGWAVGDKGTIIHTSDGGDTWTRQESGVTADLEGVTFIDDHSGFVVGDSGTLLATTDGGVSWTPQSPPPGLPAGSTIYAVTSVDGRRAWAADESGGVDVTTDGGAAWSRSRVASSTTPLFDIFFPDDSHGWVAGDSGVFYTTDGGTTWSRQSANRTLFAIVFADPSHGWAAGGGVILRTLSGGSAWQNVTPKASVDEKVALFAIAAQDAQHVWAVGSRTVSLGHSQGVVLHSSDGGGRWTEVSTPLMARVPFWAGIVAGFGSP